jgi:hypothetical protein
MVSVGNDDGLIDHLTLVRDRQTVLRGQLTELFMGEAHDYRMRIIIKRPGAVSTENLSCDLEEGGLPGRPDRGSATTTGIGTRFWMDCRQTGSDLMPAYRDLADLFTCNQEPNVSVHQVFRSGATGVELW